jgi:nickel-dependent lactate racemase
MKNQLYHTLTEPLGLPPLRQMVFPNDRIVLVPDTEYAAEYDIILDIVHIFLEQGADPQQLTLLLTDAEEKSAMRSLQPRLPDGVRILFHRSGNRSMLARLGVNDADEPIVFCRELIDADLILTIGRFHLRPIKHYFGIHSAVFPRFSDSETQQRFQTAGAEYRKLLAEAEQASSLLGIIFTVQFLQQKGKTVQIAAGLPELVAKKLQCGK